MVIGICRLLVFVTIILLSIVFPLKFLFQCDRCWGSLWLWGSRGWVAGSPRYWVIFILPGARAGRSQTSEQDEASFERRRREPLGGCGGMLPPPPRKF